jgi:hypothetical protein
MSDSATVGGKIAGGRCLDVATGDVEDPWEKIAREFEPNVDTEF